MSDHLQIRSPLAMRIARCDRGAFNAAVAAGFYRCAPDVRAGSTRVFAVDDVVALYVFARLMERHMIPRGAGWLACELRSVLHAFPEEDVLYVVLGEMASARFVPESRLAQVENTFGIQGGRPWTHRLSFNVEEIRRVINESIEEERRIIGSDDDGAN